MTIVSERSMKLVHLERRCKCKTCSQFKNEAGDCGVSDGGRSRSATTLAIALAAIDNGADVIELGVPFSDPLADGPVIQRASERAVARGVRLADVLEIARQLRAARPDVRHCDLHLSEPGGAHGDEAVLRGGEGCGRGWRAADRHDCGRGGRVSGGDEGERARAGLSGRAHQSRRATEGDRRGIAGFVYAISRVGITGTQQKVAGDASELVARLRKFTEPLGIPIALGFGISNAEHVRAVGEFADAAVIGSALVALIEKTAPAEARRRGRRIHRGPAA